MKIKIYQIDAQGYFTGAVDEVEASAPAPQGWTRSEPPTVGDGEWAVFDGRWRITGTAPGKTPAEMMTEELAELALVYEDDTLGFQRRMATITLADGPTEATKIAAIRAQWQTRKAQYITDSAAVRAKYAGV